MIKKLMIGIVFLVLLAFGGYFIASRVSSKVQVSRVINAPIDRIWSNWTDAETMKRWWGPKDYTAPVIKNDFRVGGNFLFSMKSPSGEIHYNTGVYTDIALNKKIVSKMSFSDESGNPLPASQLGIPGQWPDHVDILVEFTEFDGQKTKIEIIETGIPLVMSVFAKMGWEQQFDKFQKIVEE